MSLTSRQIRQLRSIAQRLDPILHLGKAGVTDAFIASLDQAPNDHELTKIKFTSLKDEKNTLAEDIAARTNSELVWIVGHVAVFYRAQADPAKRRVPLES
ncbi:MAG TPA: YhbY family RNA-binding protein [Verrucomicrobiae bacterium]|nr:YhbY family RNA-binding protein [Verrucomicrobiae bacterium]